MEEHQNMRLPHDTTGWNHSYYMRIPHSAPHSLQQLQCGASSPPFLQILASTREPHDAATPSSVSCPQVTHSAITPQVQTGPTRTATSDLMSATLAVAATPRISHLLNSWERCILLRSSPPPPLVSTQLPLAEFSLRCIHLQDLRGPQFHFRRTTFSVRRVPDPPLRYSWTWLCLLLRAVFHLPMPPPN